MSQSLTKDGSPLRPVSAKGIKVLKGGIQTLTSLSADIYEHKPWAEIC